MKNKEEELMKAVAEEMAKPQEERFKILRKYLGDEEVDEWERAYWYAILLGDVWMWAPQSPLHAQQLDPSEKRLRTRVPCREGSQAPLQSA